MNVDVTVYCRARCWAACVFLRKVGWTLSIWFAAGEQSRHGCGAWSLACETQIVDCRQCDWWSGRTEAPARGGPSVESVIRHDISKKAGRDSDFVIAVCGLLLNIIDVLNDILLWCRGLGDR